jgi:3alpha(or 20beta)-hydroxysteroid dehydrogenase
MAGRLAGKVALITGAARGQGAAEARLFAAEGARVVLADVLEEPGRALARELGGAARFTALDVSKPADWARAVRELGAGEGRLDVLVNNAGIYRRGRIEEMPLAEFVRVVEVNQIGCFLGMKHAVPLLRAAGGGSIVNISSIAGKTGVPGGAAYAATKWAILGLTRSAALELARDKIRVNAICPGSVDTPMIAPSEFPNVDQPAYWATLPIPRAGRAEEIARCALFLASDESSYCTGAELVVDGGKLAG